MLIWGEEAGVGVVAVELGFGALEEFGIAYFIRFAGKRYREMVAF